jgi:hypothetical protein
VTTDDVERLMHAYGRPAASHSTAAKLDVLMHLERLRDERVVLFLLAVLEDRDEAPEVRMHVLKRLRDGLPDGPMTAGERAAVARALSELMLHGSSLDLRLQATVALGEFTDIPGVASGLGSLALAARELLDLRYSAFTSLERAGPTPECIDLLRRLSNDELLGRSAESALARWHLHPRE